MSPSASPPPGAAYGGRSAVRRKRFPWLLLILLLGSIYGFWIYPARNPAPPVKIEYVPAAAQATPKR